MKTRFLSVCVLILCIPAAAALAQKDNKDAKPAKFPADKVNAALNQARAATAEKRFEDSEALMLQVTQTYPQLALPWVELGNAQMGLKKYPEAETSFKMALGMKPEAANGAGQAMAAPAPEKSSEAGGNAGGLPPLGGGSGGSAGGAAGGLPPIGGGNASALPPLGGGSGASAGGAAGGLPPLGGGNASALPPIGGGSAGGLPPIGGGSAGGLPPIGGGNAGGLPPIGGGSAKALAPLGAANSNGPPRPPQVLGAAYASLGEVYAHEGKIAEAQAAFDEATRMLPSEAPQYRSNETLVFFQTGHGDAEFAAAKQAIALNPGSSYLYYFEGQALVSQATIDPKTQKLMLPPECVEAFQKYLKIDPNGRFAADIRGILAAGGVAAGK